MKKTKFGRYLVLSLFFHAGLVIGIDAFFRSPAKETPDALFPVETVVLREEPVPPQSEPTISQQVFARRILETKSQASPSTETRSNVPDLAGPLPEESDFEPSSFIDQLPTLDVFPEGRKRDRKTLEAKSRISAGTETRLNLDDLAGPLPKEGDFKPSLSVEHVPTLGALPVSREGEEVVSKPVVSTSQTQPLRLAPVYPSRPDQSLILEVEMPKVLTEAKTRGREPYSQTLKKTEVPMGRNRLSADSISELPPIPTVESPSIPEQKEMILAAPIDLPQGQMAKLERSRSPQIPVPMKRNRLSADPISELPPIPTAESPSMPEQKETVLPGLNDLPRVLVDRFETATKPQLMEKTGLRFNLGKVLTGRPEIINPNVKPTGLDLKIRLSYPFPGSAKGAAFLFVLDTSGSVKGPPFKGIKKSALEFVELMGQKDRAGIMTFNDTTELVSTFTSEKKLLERKINNLRTAGKWTVLFDALIEAIDVIKREDRESRFVILFSDGKDEGSRSTLEEVIQKTRQSGVSILCVGYSRVKEKKYLDTLREIAGETEGVFADAPQFRDIVMLYRAFRDMSAHEIELRDVSADETHKIQVSKKGYETEVETITLGADDRREVRAVLIPPLSGEIRISSAPSKAKVYLNGKDMGSHTPTRLSGLSPGRYKLKLEKEGYRVWEDEVILRASKPLDLSGVKLQEAFGRLNLRVSPWADVYYMGKKLGTTPLANIRFQEGTHKLILKNPPLKIEKQVTVQIVADRVTKRSVDITEGIKGKLKIRVTPWAHVYVDGKPMGTTPLEPLELLAGEHEVLLRNETLKVERSFKIVIKANEVVSKNVNLL